MWGKRRIVNWLLACLIVGGIVALFVSPLALTQTPPSDPSAVPPAPDLSTYPPDVLALIETTYLGRSKEFPDPGEPAVVLQKYLEQNAHGYHSQLAEQEQKLDAELAAWRGLTHQYPESRHALVALAVMKRGFALTDENRVCLMNSGI